MNSSPPIKMAGPNSSGPAKAGAALAAANISL
jgi:hypothetical protein